jgi:hypothetical protein
MTAPIQATPIVKTVATPNNEYNLYVDLWKKTRAVLGGERFVKAYDNAPAISMTNLLIPFSPSMDYAQYSFYKAEAEFPGITSQFSKMLIGGLLRKKPVLELPENLPEDVENWIMNEFGQDDSPLTTFLERALIEELATNRTWLFVDYPYVENPDDLTKEEKLALKPYPIIWEAEKVINWKVSIVNGKQQLNRVIIREYEEEFLENEFHPTLIDTVTVHQIVEGKYIIVKYKKKVLEDLTKQNVPNKTDSTGFIQDPKIIMPIFNGAPLTFIPAWPLNGSFDIEEPILMPLIDKEIAIYNKMSRRNHLLYGASTYTPVVMADISEEEFNEIVNGGLGTWIKLGRDDKIEALETPTAALKDMEIAIAANIEEMAKMGVRMLTPETDQSGVALEIRNASQTAQMGSLNNKTSNTFSQIIAFMINWRYGTDLKVSDIKFSLSADFNPMPVGEGWLRLATEWYETGKIPRSVWLQILKQNDMIPPDYDDEEGKKEITEDLDLLNPFGEKDQDYSKGKLED